MDYCNNGPIITVIMDPLLPIITRSNNGFYYYTLWTSPTCRWSTPPRSKKLTWSRFGGSPLFLFSLVIVTKLSLIWLISLIYTFINGSFQISTMVEHKSQDFGWCSEGYRGWDAQLYWSHVCYDHMSYQRHRWQLNDKEGCFPHSPFL